MPVKHIKSVHDMALMRLDEVLKVIPISRSAWYRGVREGRYPAGIQLSARTTAWRAADIITLLESMGV